MMIWEQPLFGLYLKKKGTKVNLSGESTLTDITAMPYQNYGLELKKIINTLDFEIFVEELKNVDDVESFLYEVGKDAIDRGWIGKEWVSTVLILPLHVQGVPIDKCEALVDWCYRINDAMNHYDELGMAIMIYVKIGDELNHDYGRKMDYLKSQNTKKAPDTFRKMYQDVEKEMNKQADKRSPHIKQKLEQITPLIKLRQ